MLDILERLGVDFDRMDCGLSVRIHSIFFRNHKSQSLCAYMVHRGCKRLVRLVGVKHCLRSYDRYYHHSK